MQMPLYKRKPFPLVGKPEDLKPEELIFQIRLTKEIFRSYNEYLKRINLYRKRVWTCKATGRGNLTYEEALVSEEKASKRIKSIPAEFVTFILHDVQFSMINLKDLVDTIAAKLQGPLIEGAELYGKKNGRLHPCKIRKVIEDVQRTQYEIEWLSNDHRNNEKALVDGEDLTGNNLPFSKRLLKSFIKDSTYRSLPWVLHENLAKKHGIPVLPPEELKTKFFVQNGSIVNRKRKRCQEKGGTLEATEKDIKVYRRRNKVASDVSLPGQGADEGDQCIKYPIDDLLVQPTEEDLFLMERPSPCKQFNVPMDCVGDLLMVWDFCTSFGRLLKLSPFSLEDFENSLCYKDNTPLLVVESYLALFRLLVNDNGKFFIEAENRKGKRKVTWDDLCDFLETSCTTELSMDISTIKQGQYSLLEVHVKLGIFCELVAKALETDTFKNKLDEYTEERQALAATRRDEALVEGRKRRQEKERRKSEASGKEVKSEQREKSDEDQSTCNDHTPEISNGRVPSHPNNLSGNSESGRGENGSKKNAKKHNIESNISSDDINNPSKRDIHKLMKNEIKEQIEMKSAEERKEFLEREMEKRSIRTTPLGKDRNCKKYWFFRRDGRIFVESSNPKEWGYYQTKEEIDSLIGSLNIKGERERALKKQFQRVYDKICSALEKRPKEATQGIEMEEALVRRSTRVRAPPRDDPALTFLKYVNKWK